MKKRIAVMLMVIVMVLSFAGCAKRTMITVKLPDIGEFEIVQKPDKFLALGSTEDSVKITVNEYGDYPFVVKTDDGTEYSFVVKYEKSGTSVDAGDLTCWVGVE